ncbi:ROK family protein [Paludibacter sp.]
MKHAIGIDLGGTFIKFGVIDQNGSILYTDILPTSAETCAEDVIQNLIKAVKAAQKIADDKNIKLEGVGIGTPGIVDKTNRIVVGAAENIAGWENVPLADRIEASCGLKTVLNNDANMMGLGEQKFGAAKGDSDVLFITVGTGIGGAIIINGKLFGGYDNRGTEMGHIPLIANGVPCACGSVGCFEAYASTSALVKEFSEKALKSGMNLEEIADGKLIVALYKKSVDLAVECMENHFNYLGRGIAGLVNIFSPQKVVIGGGISEAGDFYIEKIDEYFRKYVMTDCAVNTTLVQAKLGNKAGMLGAAQMILDFNE